MIALLFLRAECLDIPRPNYICLNISFKLYSKIIRNSNFQHEMKDCLFSCTICMHLNVII